MHSVFLLRNKGNNRGVAVRINPKTDVALLKCKFRENVAFDFGVIFNRGNLHVDRCEFYENVGKVSLKNIAIVKFLKLTLF